MKRVLFTGMSGTGKSTMIRALAALGYRAVDLDEGWCEGDAEGAWLWREKRVSELLADETVDTLFVSGCSDNQVDYYPLFDHIVLLTAPATSSWSDCSTEPTMTTGGGQVNSLKCSTTSGPSNHV